MRDDQRFQPVTGTFDDTYRQYHGAGLVALVLRIADGLNRRSLARWFSAHVEDRTESLGPILPTSGRRLAGND